MTNFCTLFFVILTGCTSVNVKPLPDYTKVFELSVGTATKDEVLALFGAPGESIIEGSRTDMRYSDTEGNQRLTVFIDTESRRVVSYLFVPKLDEKLSSVEYLKTTFPGAMFSAPIAMENGSHYQSSEYTIKDDRLGVTILFDKTRGLVHGVARFDVGGRAPAEKR